MISLSCDVMPLRPPPSASNHSSAYIQPRKVFGTLAGLCISNVSSSTGAREMIQKGFKEYLEKRDKATEKIVNIFHYNGRTQLPDNRKKVPLGEDCVTVIVIKQERSTPVNRI